MSRGISKQQQIILDVLVKTKMAQSVGDLVVHLYGMDSTRSQEVSMRRALYSLEKRGQVYLAKGVVDMFGEFYNKWHTLDGRTINIPVMSVHNRGQVLIADLPDREKVEGDPYSDRLFWRFHVMHLISVLPKEALARVNEWGRQGKATRQHLRVCIANGDDMPHGIKITDEDDGAVLFDGVLAEQQAIMIGPHSCLWKDGRNVGGVNIKIGNLGARADLDDNTKLTLTVTDNGIAGEVDDLALEDLPDVADR